MAVERHLRRVSERLPVSVTDMPPASDASDAVILHLWQATQIVIDLAMAACLSHEARHTLQLRRCFSPIAPGWHYRGGADRSISCARQGFETSWRTPMTRWTWHASTPRPGRGRPICWHFSPSSATTSRSFERAAVTTGCQGRICPQMIGIIAVHQRIRQAEVATRYSNSSGVRLTTARWDRRVTDSAGGTGSTHREPENRRPVRAVDEVHEHDVDVLERDLLMQNLGRSSCRSRTPS